MFEKNKYFFHFDVIYDDGNSFKKAMCNLITRKFLYQFFHSVIFNGFFF